VPRPRDVTMKKLDPQELHSAALRRAIKLHSPYEVVDEKLVGSDGDGYAIVYRAPLGGDRMIAATRTKHGNAVKLRDLLNGAWARGYYSSGREKGS
jgi:hypothetical protein